MIDIFCGRNILMRHFCPAITQTNFKLVKQNKKNKQTNAMHKCISLFLS